jgi:hypothetical protein
MSTATQSVNGNGDIALVKKAKFDGDTEFTHVPLGENDSWWVAPYAPYARLVGGTICASICRGGEAPLVANPTSTRAKPRLSRSGADPLRSDLTNPT